MIDLELLLKNKIGLVLSGGGAKGAYQIGVFKALKELEITRLVKVVSGTSIGALNGALFLSDDPDLWQETWQDATFNNFLRKKDKEDGQPSIRSFTDLKDVFKKSLRKLEEDWRQSAKLSDFVLKQNLSLFTLKGLEEVLDRHLDLNRIIKNKLSLYTCAYNIDQLQPEYFLINDLDAATAKKAIMASACIPFMYEPIQIASDRYMDGGIKNPLYEKDNVDNIPLKPVYDNKCDIIIIVYLNHSAQVDHSQYQGGAKIVELYPSTPLEEVKGTGVFDFSRSSLEDRIELGYHDAMFIIAPMIVKWFLGKSVDELISRHNEYNQRIRGKYISDSDEGDVTN